MSFDLHNTSVLVVEDNAAMRRIIGSSLRAFGLERMFFAETVAEALAKIKQHRPDVIVAAWTIPSCDGLNMTRRLRAGDGPAKRIPVVLISSHTEVRQVQEAFAAGIDGFLAKPFSATLLFDRISGALSQQEPATGDEAGDDVTIVDLL